MEFEFIARLRIDFNGTRIDAEKKLVLGFVPYPGMGFCISNRYHELTVKNVWVTDDHNDNPEMAIVFNEITSRSSFDEISDVVESLESEGWTVST